jgi:hypothetical protein
MLALARSDWAIGAIAALSLIAPAVSPAATIEVTVTADAVADDGECSLREAVSATNGNLDVNGADDCDHDGGTGPDTIELVAPGASFLNGYDVTGPPGDNANATGDLDIEGGTGGLTIRGVDTNDSTIDADEADRVIEHEGGALTLEDLTVRDGGVAGNGGGILSIGSGGSLALDGADVVSNEAGGSGAGIYATAALAITDSVIASNHSAADSSTIAGGGIAASGATTIADSVISGNSVTDTSSPGNGATMGGGGIAQRSSGSLTITRTAVQVSTVTSENAISFPSGGAILVSDANLTIRESTVTSATLSGGNSRAGAGILFSDGTANNTAEIENVTVSGNSAGPASSGGGGIEIFRGVTEITNSTIAGNSANLGSALQYQDLNQAGSSLTARATIFSDDGSGECYLPSSVLVTDGYNVDAGNTCVPADGTSLLNTDPLLEPLDGYGGPTLTRAVPAGSEALNLIPPGACVDVDDQPVPVDQRGLTRPFGGGCEPGAYELSKCRGALVDGGTLFGTPGDDVINGQEGPNRIVGLGGKDKIKAKAGKDRACGGPGADTIAGGDGGDKLAGDAGNDKLRGGDGKDACGGGPGKDKLFSCE